jgi:hypothetical protein
MKLIINQFSQAYCHYTLVMSERSFSPVFSCSVSTRWLRWMAHEMWPEILYTSYYGHHTVPYSYAQDGGLAKADKLYILVTRSHFCEIGSSRLVFFVTVLPSCYFIPAGQVF